MCLWFVFWTDVVVVYFDSEDNARADGRDDISDDEWPVAEHYALGDEENRSGSH